MYRISWYIAHYSIEGRLWMESKGIQDLQGIIGEWKWQDRHKHTHKDKHTHTHTHKNTLGRICGVLIQTIDPYGN